MNLTGFHHLTAVSSAIRENKKFYTQTLGMRLVKRSVNQDDVSAYHLFYADADGHPGTDITFFDWDAPKEKRGTHSIVRTGLRVKGAQALAWWENRFRELGVNFSERGVQERDGRLTLDFEDPEGQRLALVDDGGTGDVPTAWDKSSVPAEYQIRGLGPITLSVPTLEGTDDVLKLVMGAEQVRDFPHPDNPKDKVFVYKIDPTGDGPHTELHVGVQPDLPVVHPGAGGVHHVAFRVPNYEEYDAWAERLNAMRVPNSGKVDRFWFRSLYFREPNGILFELATDPPGFGVDEDMATLGEKLVLPPFLEGRRAQIEAGLKPID